MNTQTTVSNKILEITVGLPGRMMTGSKSGYCKTYPENVALFNANLIVPEGDGFSKIWHGDLDLTFDGEKILKLSEKIKLPIYVLREMDARFDTEEEPRIEKHIASYDSSRAQNLQVEMGSYQTEYYTQELNVIKLRKP
jgi:hypothetical protein